MAYKIIENRGEYPPVELVETASAELALSIARAARVKVIPIVILDSGVAISEAELALHRPLKQAPGD